MYYYPTANVAHDLSVGNILAICEKLVLVSFPFFLGSEFSHPSEFCTSSCCKFPGFSRFSEGKRKKFKSRKISPRFDSECFFSVDSWGSFLQIFLLFGQFLKCCYHFMLNLSWDDH
jgi:hypothetical protein